MQKKSKVKKAFKYILDENVSQLDAAKYLYNLKQEIGGEEFKVQLKESKKLLQKVVDKIAIVLLYEPYMDQHNAWADQEDAREFYKWREEQQNEQ